MPREASATIFVAAAVAATLPFSVSHAGDMMPLAQAPTPVQTPSGGHRAPDDDVHALAARRPLGVLGKWWSRPWRVRAAWATGVEAARTVSATPAPETGRTAPVSHPGSGSQGTLPPPRRISDSWPAEKGRRQRHSQGRDGTPSGPSP